MPDKLAKKFEGFLLACFFLVLIGLASFGGVSPKQAAANSTTVQLQVLICNNNAICEDVIGEDYLSCPSDCPAPPAPTSTPPVGGGSGSTVTSSTSTTPNEIRNIQISPDFYSATLSLKTLFASIASISWGETPDYEIGSLSEAWYHNDFNVKIENLKPGTRYYFNLTLKDSLGDTINYLGQFTTLSLPDVSPPSAPADLAAYLNANQIVLNWKVPTDSDFSYVRLVRSDIFYPRTPLEGKVVYEGRGTQVTDSSLVPGTLYFYSLFAYDRSGNVSAPAIAAVYYPLSPDDKGPKTNLDTDPINPDDSSDPVTGPGMGPDGTGVPYDPLLDDNFPYVVPDYSNPFYEYTFCNSKGGFSNKGLREIRIEDLSITQAGKKISFTNSRIVLEPNLPVRIELNATDAALDDARALAFCINNRIPEVRRGYMFSYNTATRKFEVEIPTFFSTHSYEFYVGMLKYKSKETVLASGEFTIKQHSSADRQSALFGIDFRKILSFSFLLLIVVLAIRFLQKRASRE